MFEKNVLLILTGSMVSRNLRNTGLFSTSNDSPAYVVYNTLKVMPMMPYLDTTLTLVL